MYHLFLNGNDEGVSAVIATNRAESITFYSVGITHIVIHVNVDELNKQFDHIDGAMLLVSGNISESTVLATPETSREFADMVISAFLQCSVFQFDDDFFEMPDIVPDGIPAIIIE